MEKDTYEVKLNGMEQNWCAVSIFCKEAENAIILSPLSLPLHTSIR